MRFLMAFVLSLSLFAGNPTSLEALEEALLQAQTVQFGFEIEATGSMSAHIKGSFTLEKDNRVTLGASGAFMEQEVAPVLASDGTHMRSPAGVAKTPADLGEALVLGITRQGLLHNLAVMSMGGAPDGTDGQFRRRFKLVKNGDPIMETLDGATALALPFRIDVDGAPVGSGTLWLDGDSGMPVKRQQLVHFPGGDMNVTESYRAFRLDQPLDKVIGKVALDK